MANANQTQSRSNWHDGYFPNKQSCHTKFFQRLQDIFNQESFGEIHKPDSKLRTFKHLKIDVGFENYISAIPSEKERVALSKFRLSNHQLMIEKGRHRNIPKELRFCPICPRSIENEVHFLILCKGYREERQNLFEKIIKSNKIFPYKNDLEKFKYLLTNEYTIRDTSRFILQCNQIRETLIYRLVLARVVFIFHFLFMVLYILFL